MKFENWMTCEKYVDDGSYSIGYVDKSPAQWDGNTELAEGEEFLPSSEGNTFGVNCQDEFIVREGKWCMNEPSHGGYRPGAGRKPTGRKRQSFSVTDEEHTKLKECLATLRLKENAICENK